MSTAEHPSRKFHIGAIVFLALLVLFLAIQLWDRAFRVEGNDFGAYREAAATVLQGENPYLIESEFHFLYPLFFAVALIPFVPLPYGFAVYLWFGLSVAALLIALLIICRACAVQARTTRWPAIALVMFLALGIVQSDWVNGQVNSIVLLLCVLFWRLLHAERPALAALMLALGICIKLVPALFLFYLLLRGQWRALGYTLALVLLFFALPTLFLGAATPEIYLAYLREFVLPGLLEKPAAPYQDIVKETVKQFSFRGMLKPLLPSVLAAVLGVGGVLLPLLLIQWRAHKRTAREAADLWIFLLYLVAIPLLAPMSETHHLILILPPMLALFLAATEGNGMMGKNRILAATAFIAANLFLLLGVHGESSLATFAALVVLVCAVAWGAMAEGVPPHRPDTP